MILNQRLLLFLARALAYVLDIVLGVLIFLGCGAVLAGIYYLGYEWFKLPDPFKAFASSPILLVFLCSIGSIFGMLVPPVYVSYFESSKWQGTPGKLCLNLTVTDKVGNRLSFWKAFLRIIVESLSWPITSGIFALVMILALTAIHAPVDTATVSTCCQLIILILFLATMFLTARNQTVFDLIAGRVVQFRQAEDQRAAPIQAMKMRAASTRKLAPLVVVVLTMVGIAWICQAATQGWHNFQEASAQLNKGISLIKQNKLDEANKCIDAAKSIDHNIENTFPFTHTISSTTPDDTVAYYTAMIRLNKKNSQYFLDRGKALDALENYLAALDDLTTALNLTQDGIERSTILAERAGTFAHLKEWQSAIKDAEESIKNDRLYAQPHTVLKECYEQEHLNSRASRESEWIKELNGLQGNSLFARTNTAPDRPVVGIVTGIARGRFEIDYIANPDMVLTSGGTLGIHYSKDNRSINIGGFYHRQIVVTYNTQFRGVASLSDLKVGDLVAVQSMLQGTDYDANVVQKLAQI